MTCSISGGTLTASFIAANIGAGTYTITATGSPGSDYATANFQLVTSTPSIALSPTSAQAGATVQVSGSGFYTTDTSCTISGSVVNTQTCSISGGTLTGSFVVNTASVGSYTLTATGNQGDSAVTTFAVNAASTQTTTSSTTVTYSTSSSTSTMTSVTTVSSIGTTTSTSVATTTITPSSSTTQPPIPQCLIATASYGSELAPEVQILRNFRDNSLMKTVAGSSFMIVFNAWYYSFSPAVASQISTSPAEMMVMRGVLYPLIGILKLSSLTFSATSAVPELAAFLSGLVASSLIGAVYLGLPLSLVRTKIRRLRGSGVQSGLVRVLLVAMLIGISTLLVGELLASVGLLMVASTTIVLSTLFLSGVYSSDLVARKLSHNLPDRTTSS